MGLLCEVLARLVPVGVVEAVVVDATPVMVPLVSTWSGMIPYGSGQSEEDTS